MIKCPKCGSTAQVKCTWMDDEPYATDIYREYNCGCGCNFFVTYRIANVEIILKETEKEG